MQQASFKCETPRLKLKSSRTFLAIKRCERTKIGKVIKQSRSSKLRWAHICAYSRIPVNGPPTIGNSYLFYIDHNMVLSSWLWPTTKSSATKNAGKSTTISMAMVMQRYDAGRIAQWSTSRASLKATATGCHHRASACAVFPVRPPWSKNSNKTHKTLPKHNF